MPDRPPISARLDRLALLAARVLRRLLPRPQEGALEHLARADRGPRPDPITMPVAGIDQARRALSEGRLAEALHLFSEILGADADSAWAWHGRGDALQLLDQPEDALDAYSRATSLAPREGLHHGGRANALYSLARTEEADAAWAEALRLDPTLGWMRPAP